MGRHCSFFLGLIRTDLASLCGECRFLMPILQLLGTHNLCPFLLLPWHDCIMRHCKGGWLSHVESTVFQQSSNAPRKNLAKEVIIGCNIDQDRPKGGFRWMLATCIGALPPLLSGKALTKRSAMSQIRVEGGPPSAFCSVKNGNWASYLHGNLLTSVIWWW